MEQHHIKITSFNCLNPCYEVADRYEIDWNGKKVNPYLYNRYEKLRSYIASIKSDIYCLQEVTESITVSIKEKLESDNPNTKYYSFNSNRNDRDGCSIIWSDRFEYTDFIGGGTQRYKGGEHIIQFVYLREKNNKSNVFKVINTHVNWSSRNEDITNRLYSFFKNDYIKGPLILMGDFNAEVTEGWYPKFQEDDSIIDAFKNNRPEYTFMCSKGGIQTKTIDHCFVRNCDKNNIVSKVFVKEETYDKFPYIPSENCPSDHLPIQISIKFS